MHVCAFGPRLNSAQFVIHSTPLCVLFFLSPFVSLFTPISSICLPISHIFILLYLPCAAHLINSIFICLLSFSLLFCDSICNLISRAPLLSVLCFIWTHTHTWSQHSDAHFSYLKQISHRAVSLISTHCYC